MNELISRQAAIDALTEEKEMINAALDSLTLDYNARRNQEQRRGQINEDIETIKALPPTQPEIIHCKDCIYYDPEHVEKDGVRYEYGDMPKDAFDILGTNLVNSKYGVNVGGRCCRDYNVGYPEDKRVFVSEQNFCGRAERKEE